MKKVDSKGFCIYVNGRFLCGFKRGRISTAWSIAGATIYYQYNGDPMSNPCLKNDVEELKKRGDKYQIFAIELNAVTQ